MQVRLFVARVFAMNVPRTKPLIRYFNALPTKKPERRKSP
jgi:hypothetical protein